MRPYALGPQRLFAASAVLALVFVVHVAALTIVDVPLGQRLEFGTHIGSDLRFFRLPTRQNPSFLSRASLTIGFYDQVLTLYSISYGYPDSSTATSFENNTAIVLTLQNDVSNPVDTFLYLNAFPSVMYTGAGSILFSSAPITSAFVPTIDFNKVYVFSNVSLSAFGENFPVARFFPRVADNTAYGVVLHPTQYSHSFGSYVQFTPEQFSSSTLQRTLFSLPNYITFSPRSILANVTVAVVVSNDTRTLVTPFSEQLTITAFKPFLIAIKWLDLPQSVNEGRNTSITFTIGAGGTFEVRQGKYRWPDIQLDPRDVLSSSRTITIAACSISYSNSTFLSVVWKPANYDLSQIAAESLKTTISIQSSSSVLATRALAPSTQLSSASSSTLVELTGVPRTPATVLVSFAGTQAPSSISIGSASAFGANSDCTQSSVSRFSNGASLPTCQLFATASATTATKMFAAIPAFTSFSYTITPSAEIPLDGSVRRVSGPFVAIPAGASFPLAIQITPVSLSSSVSTTATFYQKDCTGNYLAAPSCFFSFGSSTPCTISLSCPSQAIYMQSQGGSNTFDVQVIRNGSTQAVSATLTTPLTVDLTLNSISHLDITVPPSSTYDVLVSASANIVEQPFFLPGGCQATNSFSQVVRGAGISDETTPSDPKKSQFTLTQSGTLVLRATRAAMTYTITFSSAASPPSPTVFCQSVSSVILPDQCVGRISGTQFISLRYDRADESSNINDSDADLAAINPALAEGGACREHFLTMLCMTSLPLCSSTTSSFYQRPCYEDCAATAALRGCTGMAAYQICAHATFLSCDFATDAFAPVTTISGGQSPVPSPQPGSSSPSAASAPVAQGAGQPAISGVPSSQPGSSSPSATSSPAQVNSSSVVSISAALMTALSCILLSIM